MPPGFGSSGQLSVPTDPAGSISPTAKSTAGAAAYGQTLFTFTANPSLASGYTSPTIVTVPAGNNPLTGTPYIGYVTDLYCGSNSATQFLAQLLQAATPIFDGYCKGDTGPLNLLGFETQPQIPAGAALTLVLGTAAATVAGLYVAGFYQ
jgi:hypothetical protein